VYRDTPGDRLAGLDRHSVHSRVITSRTPLFFAMEGRAPLSEQSDKKRLYSSRGGET
jgi:hypothetical protein